MVDVKEGESVETTTVARIRNEEINEIRSIGLNAKSHLINNNK